MPAGVDFTCKNENCECFNKSITILSTWPIAEIDDVIVSIEDDSCKNDFKEMKENGAEYACIQYPNTLGVEMVGWKIQRWCQNCPRIGYDEIILNNPKESFEDAVIRYNIEEECPVCNEKVKTFDEVIEDGILCPFCKEEMQMNRWFAKEVS